MLSDREEVVCRVGVPGVEKHRRGAGLEGGLTASMNNNLSVIYLVKKSIEWLFVDCRPIHGLSDFLGNTNIVSS